MTKPTWWDYAIFNDDGLCGISDDAPEEEKKKYYEFIEEREKIKREGKWIPK